MCWEAPPGAITIQTVSSLLADPGKRGSASRPSERSRSGCIRSTMVAVRETGSGIAGMRHFSAGEKMRRESKNPGDPLPLTVAMQIDGICKRFENAWKSGPTPRLEDFLDDVHGPERAALLRELLRVELDFHRQRGSLPAAETYLARFPEHPGLIHAE